MQTNFKINELITLKFNYPHTEIYISGKYFMQCKRLLLNIPKDQQNQYNTIESIDEAAEIYNHTIYKSQILKDEGIPNIENDENLLLITPEEEFWGHCSNLQVWSEHDYDTRLLKANLAFPLLEKLAEEGDEFGLVKFKEEILKRMLSGSESVVEYLFVEGYQDNLSNEELLFGLLESSEAEILMEIQQKLNIILKFVPSINRGLEVDWNERNIIHKFSMKNKKVSGLDLSKCNLNELPYEIFKLKKLQVLNIGRNPSFKLSFEYLMDILNKLRDLKIIIFDREQMEKIQTEIKIKKLLKKKNLKAIRKPSSDFTTLDSINLN